MQWPWQKRRSSEVSFEAGLEAVAAGDEAALRHLLKKDPALAEARDATGLTLLLHAVGLNSVSSTSVLLESGARPDTGLPGGATPLSIALLEGRTALVSMLLAHGADPNQQDPHGSTLLMFSARRNDTQSVELLLEAKADVALRDADGETALMYAARAGALDAAKALLSGGAQVHIRNFDGLSPLDIASGTAMEDLLRDWAYPR